MRREIDAVKKKLESFLVCADFSNDIPVLVVGTKVKNGINVINAFKGEEAEELYHKLSDKKGEKN